MSEAIASKNEMFCHRQPDGKYHYFYPSRGVVEMCSVPVDEIIHVRLLPDDDGTYWCWHDFKDDSYSMVYPAFVLLEMCFTYGIKVEEDRGRGKRARVRVEEIPE